MTIRTNKRRKYDLAHHQIAALAEVAHQVHPRIILTHCPSNKEIIELLIDIKEIRRRAREHIERGAVTPEYKSNRVEVVRVLNEALATEIVCVLRYKRHQYMAAGINAIPVREPPRGAAQAGAANCPERAVEIEET